MAQLPYIPIYIGDWEQDTNCISLQAEAAWLKVVFKMFRNDKSGIYKTSTKSLQNLWKTDTKGVHDILNELIENNICDIEMDDIIIFRNRRMIREKEISQIRSKSVQKRYKTSTKHIQNTEIENEIENDIVIVNDNNVKKVKAQKKKFSVPSLEEIKNFASENMIGSDKLPETFFNYYEANGWRVGNNSMKNWQAAFRNWANKEKTYQHGAYQQQHEKPVSSRRKGDIDAIRSWGQDLIDGRVDLSGLFGSSTP